MHKCDEMANSYYNLDASGKRRAARDWLEQVKKTAKMINNRFKKPIMDEKGEKFSQSF
jgi:predicted LPLAT superfamily acyltransferase